MIRLHLASCHFQSLHTWCHFQSHGATFNWKWHQVHSDISSLLGMRWITQIIYDSLLLSPFVSTALSALLHQQTQQIDCTELDDAEPAGLWFAQPDSWEHHRLKSAVALLLLPCTSLMLGHWHVWKRAISVHLGLDSLWQRLSEAGMWWGSPLIVSWNCPPVVRLLLCCCGDVYIYIANPHYEIVLIS